jgi:N-methylhydantoinase B
MTGLKLDPITFEVIRNRLDMIADEMELTLLKSSFSSIIKEALDASAAIFDSKGRTLAQAAAIPCHLGMLITAAEKFIQVFKGDMHEGDVYILNDPYDGGTHLPDLAVFSPVIHNGEVVAFTATMAHHQDIGGKAPGSTAPDATEVFAEGLRIAPFKLLDQGRENATLLEIIRRNVRIPDTVLGDIKAQIASVTVGKRRIQGLVKQYGIDVLNNCIEELMKYSERITRANIEKIPDGEYTFFDYLDDDCIHCGIPVKIQATVRVKGSDIEFDFSGSSMQVSGALNSVPASTRSVAYCLVKSITDPTLPNNDGCYQPIKVKLPSGTIVNPNPPASVGARTITIKRVYDVLLGAMAKIIPEKLHAASNGQSTLCYLGGIDPKTKKAYVTIPGMPTAGGMGARVNQDGIDVIDTDVTNLMSQPIEATESETPLRVQYCRLWQDSGGAGKYRGGLGYEFEVELLRGTATLSHRRDRHSFSPWGLLGGEAAPTCKTILKRTDGTAEELPSKKVVMLQEGDKVSIFTTGGGGYGDPLERLPEKVLEDVIDGRISKQSAYDKYGVVINSNNILDREGTLELRDRLKKQRGIIDYLFDRGLGYEEKTGLPQKHS